MSAESIGQRIGRAERRIREAHAHLRHGRHEDAAIALIAAADILGNVVNGLEDAHGFDVEAVSIGRKKSA